MVHLPKWVTMMLKVWDLRLNAQMLQFAQLECEGTGLDASFHL